MNGNKDLEQTRNLELDRGLYFVHYKSAENAASPPRVVVAAAPGSERRLELIIHPEATEPVLWEPETRLVVRVTAPATLQVKVVASHPGGSQAAAVRIEPILHGNPSVGVSSPMRSSAPAASPLAQPATPGLRLIGHVAGIGDVAVQSNAWIAGPSAPSRIEGIAIDWPDRPAGVDIRYSARPANAQPGSERLVPLGTFAGTRGRAMPLTAMILEISGDTDLQLVAEAVFLNSPVLRATGRRVNLSGPTGREPLVGLRIGLESTSLAAPVSAATAAASATPRSQSSSGRVRVFRSRPKQEASSS